MPGSGGLALESEGVVNPYDFGFIGWLCFLPPRGVTTGGPADAWFGAQEAA